MRIPGRFAATIALTAQLALAMVMTGCGGASQATSTGASGADYCAGARAAQRGVEVLNQVRGSSDASLVKQALAALSTALDRLDAGAPTGISAATHTARVAFDRANATAQQAVTVTDIRDAFQIANVPSVASATKAIDEYTRTACGFAISSQFTPSPSTPEGVAISPLDCCPAARVLQGAAGSLDALTARAAPATIHAFATAVARHDAAAPKSLSPATSTLRDAVDGDNVAAQAAASPAHVAAALTALTG